MDLSGSPPPKRRSSFFQRRDSLIPKRAEENDENALDVENTKPINVDLESYLRQLQKERNDWKELYVKRKEKTYTLKRKLEEMTSPEIIKEDNLNCKIPDDVKDFIEKKPDIKAIVEKSIQFRKKFDITLSIYNTLIKNNERINAHVKSNTNKIIGYICERNDKLYRNVD